MSFDHAFVSRLLQRPIAFHRVFVDVTDGNVAAGLFLSQLYYWSDKGRDLEGWIYKTFDEWKEEIGIGRKTFEKARKILKSKGIIEEKRHGLDPRLHYRLSLENLYEVIANLDKNPPPSDPPEIPNVLSDIRGCTPSEIPNVLLDIGECPKRTLPEVLLADASYIQRIHTENTYREHSDAHKREGALAYFADSKSFEPENPETATDRGQDSGLEPLRKAKSIQNPEPETAVQDCPEPGIEPLRKAETFRNSEQNLSSRAEATKNQSPANSNLEETNIPPAAAGNSPQEAASTPTEVPKPISPDSSALTARFSHEADYHSNPVIQEAIDTYNQFRGCWGICDDLPPTAKQLLLQIYSRQVGDPEAKRIHFLALVRDAVLWMNKNDYYSGRKAHKGNYHNGKNLRFLIGERSSPDRMADFACEWRSLPQELMVGTAIQITQDLGKKKYCGLDGKETKRTWARLDWKDISRRAKAGEEITKAEKDWAEFYFPEYDIYLEHEDI